MKNFLFTALFALITLVAFGQSGTVKPTVMLSTLTKATTAQRQADTVAASTTKSQTVQISGLYDQVTIQAVATKISGTPTGKVFIMGSLDGVTFAKLDSLTLLNVAPGQTIIHTQAPNRHYWYRVQVEPTSATQSVRFNSLYLARKK